MKKTIIIAGLLILALSHTRAENSESPTENTSFLKAGFLVQKVQKLYWENGITVDYSSTKLLNSKLHLGLAYATSRLGSAIQSNAIKQDNYLISADYHFRSQKPLQLTLGLNTGYFYADYEYELFDVLDNSSLLLAANAGVYYTFKQNYTFKLSTGYNLMAGDGMEGPGTLFPVYYRLGIFYTLKTF